MFSNSFGIEVEFTGITRAKAAETAAKYLAGTASAAHGYYDTYNVKVADGREWKFMYDGSIVRQKKDGENLISAGHEYSVEMVSPILFYRKDIGTLQELVRCLRKAGGFSNHSCGIHMICQPFLQQLF